MKVLNGTNYTLKSKEEKLHVMYIVPQKTSEKVKIKRKYTEQV